MQKTIEVVFNLLMLAGWVSIAATTSGIGWSVAAVLGSFHLGIVAHRGWLGLI